MVKKNDVVETVPGRSGEMTTKERIFTVALDLFSKKGFDAVSMREIAEAVGIKKASMYSHFASKDQLLEQMFQYPIVTLTDIASTDMDAEQMILSLGVDGFMDMASGVFNKWIASPGMEKVWRIICIELYHDEHIKKFYDKFTGDTIAFWRSNFEIMRKHGLIKPVDPDTVAREYLSFYLYTFMDYFIAHYDSDGSFLDMKGKQLDEHMKFLARSIKK